MRRAHLDQCLERLLISVLRLLTLLNLNGLGLIFLTLIIGTRRFNVAREIVLGLASLAVVRQSGCAHVKSPYSCARLITVSIGSTCRALTSILLNLLRTRRASKRTSAGPVPRFSSKSS